jgi:ribosomal protein S18 acetylase RimI-like enzyme
MLEIEQIGSEALALYARIPIAYTVETVFQVTLVEGGLGGILLTEAPAEPPYVKDYDTGEGPERWPERFDLRHWGLFLTRDGETPVGGAAVATRTPELSYGIGEEGSAVLWDLRVHPDHRGQGVGQRLFRQVAEWSARQACRQLIAETQNTNVPACRFYARQGCRLGAIHRYGYAESKSEGDSAVAQETMLLWYLDL